MLKATAQVKMTQAARAMLGVEQGDGQGGGAKAQRRRSAGTGEPGGASSAYALQEE